MAKRKSQIVGGGSNSWDKSEETEVNEHPWQVGLVDKGFTNIWCGGSIISNRWILSAAECLYGRDEVDVDDIEALLGEHDYTTTSETKTYRMGISRIILHPDYPSVDINLSLLKMNKLMNFSNYPHIRPICLPNDPSEDYTGVTATMVGWGTILDGYSGPLFNKLRKVDVKVLTNNDCKNNFNYHPSWITSPNLCALNRKESCTGDLGME